MAEAAAEATEAAAPREVRLMEYRLLGLSGCAVSALALGTPTFGSF